MELPVFYRGPRAVITHSVVEVAQAVRHRFVVAELFDVHIVRHDPEPDASGRQVFGVSALAAAAISIPVVGSASILLTVLLVAVLLVYGAICVRPRRRRWWQVRAEYRGEMVEVFSSRDEREFAEFCRGLVRSLEARDR